MIASFLDLPGKLEFSQTYRYISALPTQRVGNYQTVDVRLGWQPLKNLEFSVTGQNLLDDRHPEFAPTVIPIQRTEVQRGIYGKILFRF